MGFASGFVTGLAKSVDDQLKNDMLRTQKRMDGMEQYRVTRKRADIERKQKEGNELAETLQKLASFTDGNIDYAEQVYLAVGANTADANAYYDVLKENQAVTKNFKLSDHVKFGEMVRSKDVKAKDVAANYIDGIKETKSENVKGYGLMSLFDRSKSGEQIDKKVNEQVPTTESAFGLVKRNANQLAKIDHSGMIAYKEHQKKNQAEAGSTLVGDLLKLENEYRYETDATKQAEIQARITQRRKDITQEAVLKRKATGESSAFTKPNRDSIIKSAYERGLGDKFLKPGIGGELIISLEGNEVEGWGKKIQVLNNLNKDWSSLDDTVFKSQIASEKNMVVQQVTSYKNSFKNNDTAIMGNKTFHTNNGQGYATREDMDKDTMATTSGAEPKIKKGDVAQYKDANGDLRVAVWTGTTWL
jgi:hypothetical protein